MLKFTKTLVAIVLGILIVTGCGRNEYGEADNDILCKEGSAFMIKPGAGQTSFVFRTPSLDKVCKKGV